MTDYRDFYRELRTDWLKLRGCLFDPNTDLPSLPLVLDQVRSRLEAGEILGLIYIDPSGGRRLESTCGWQTYDQLIREIAEALRHSSLGHSFQATIALVNVRSDEFVIFPRLDALSGERTEQLERLRSGLVEEVQRSHETLQRTPLRSAAVELKSEPTVRIERSIYQGLEAVRECCRQERERSYSGRLAELERILEKRDIIVHYQPVVNLLNGAIHGLEALSRAPETSGFESPDSLFSFAEETGLISELDGLCRSEAIRRSAKALGSPGVALECKLFLNCSAHAFHDGSLLADIKNVVDSADGFAENLVLEITERVAITEWQAFRESLGILRETGVKVAIDDMGSGYSSLRAVAEIEPDYLKFDRSLVKDIHRSPIKRELLATLVTLARKIGARPIAEGIETPEELETVCLMGIDFGQGYFFARPAAPEDVGPVHFPEAG